MKFIVALVFVVAIGGLIWGIGQVLIELLGTPKKTPPSPTPLSPPEAPREGPLRFPIGVTLHLTRTDLPPALLRCFRLDAHTHLERHLLRGGLLHRFENNTWEYDFRGTVASWDGWPTTLTDDDVAFLAQEGFVNEDTYPFPEGHFMSRASRTIRVARTRVPPAAAPQTPEPSKTVNRYEKILSDDD